MNGNSGIQPTVELATTNGNNGFYPYPAYPMMGGYGNDGFFGGDGIWAIILLALLFGNGGWGGFGGFGGGFGGMFEFPWLLTGQQGINNNTNQGFDTLHLSNQIEGVRDGVAGLSNQLCSCCGDITNAINTTAYNSEIAAANRQMASMQQNFNSELTTVNGFNNINNALQNCCCENRLGIANLGSDIAREACATRTNDTQNTQTLLTAITGGIQSIKDQLCQDKIDSKNDKIVDLQREILMKDLQASQVAQTADIRANNAVVANQLVSELRSCPIPAQPVYGNTPIFTCNGNGGCGCGNFTTSQFI